MPKKRAESGPSIEELFSKLEKKVLDFEDRIEKNNKEFEEKLECLAHKLENSQTFFDETTNKKNKESEEKLQSLFEKVYKIDAVLQDDMEENEDKFTVQEESIQKSNKKVKDIDEKLQSLVEKVYSMDGSNNEESEELKKEMLTLKEMLYSFKEKVELSSQMIENIQEKMYDYENTKKNNLIFYGIPTQRGETPAKLLLNIQYIIKNSLAIARDVRIECVNRVLNGPEVMGCRPVLVSFSHFKDKNEVLQKSKCVQKSSSISVTEDISKKTREARQELRRFMVNLKKTSPERKAFIEYDKLYVNGKVFVYSQEEGRVVRQQRSLTDLRLKHYVVFSKPNISSTQPQR